MDGTLCGSSSSSSSSPSSSGTGVPKGWCGAVRRLCGYSSSTTFDVLSPLQGVGAQWVRHRLTKTRTHCSGNVPATFDICQRVPLALMFVKYFVKQPLGRLSNIHSLRLFDRSSHSNYLSEWNKYHFPLWTVNGTLSPAGRPVPPN